MPSSLRMLRRIGLVFALACVLVLAVVLVLAGSLKPILNHWLPIWLGSADSPAQVHLSELSWGQLRIDTLALTLDDGSQMHLQDLHLSYRLAELWQGRVGKLQIETLRINLADARAQAVASEAVSDVSHAAQQHFNSYVDIPLLSDWLSLPIQQVSIHHLEIQHSTFSSQLQARLDSSFWRIHGQLHLSATPEPWQLELQLQDTGRWFLLLSEQNRVLLQQYGSVQQTPSSTHIELHQQLHLAQLANYFPELHPLFLQRLTVEAQISLPNQGLLPAAATVQAKIQLDGRAGSANGWRWKPQQWQLTLTKDQPQADWVFDLIAPAWPLTVPARYAGRELNVVNQIHAAATCNADLNHCQAQADLQATIAHANQHLANLNLHPTLQWQRLQGLTSTLAVSVQAPAPSATLLGLPPFQTAIAGQLSASWQPTGQWQLSSPAGVRATLTPQVSTGWRASPLQLTLLPTLNLQGNNLTQTLLDEFQAAPLLIKIAPWELQYTHQKTHIQLAASELSCRPFGRAGHLGADCTLALRFDPSTYQAWPLPDATLNGQLQLRQQPQHTQVQAQVQVLAANQQLAMRLNLNHNLDAQQGTLQWHLDDTPLNWNRLKLTDMLAQTKFDLLQGSLAGQGWIDWRQQQGQWIVTPDLSLRVDNLSALYDETLAIEGWSALIALRRPFGGDYLLDAQFSGNRLNSGVALKNILARSQTRIAPDFSWAVADIYEVRTDLLGGSIRTPLIRYDTRNTNNAFTIELDHIQLGQIAALEPSSDVKATGLLDGILPIIITPQGPQVPAGNLFARDPGGRIRYHSTAADALAQSSEGMGLAMQLLENFEYDQLQTGVEYQPDGKFNLALQFQGKNPALYGGKKTHLNVQLEYNLLDLLASLRAAQDLVNAVEEKYQPH